MLKDFRAFIMRGNVVDMAVGVIIGGAFGKIVSSLVNDIIMPPIGRLTGGVDFSSLYINLSSTAYAGLAEAQKAGAPTINYGVFLNTVVNFLIVAGAIFLVISQLNNLKRRFERPAVAEKITKECPLCLSEIPLKAVKCAHCASDIQSK
ncbi:MAG: large-conductance mechanosensitive channel protein MscL [Elusimicrobia bacterium]|nr:large-conductance mechanosensitive channel protein MscL [Elusimicrobiota bacterium]